MKKKIPLFVASTLAVSMLGDIKKRNPKQLQRAQAIRGNKY
ncbi:hypothetical protein QUF99_09180 [Bacillus sp. DX4.1]|nr:hypothetical protein [Bacillus sp. DX4.1]MDM5187486.1 hypothetical protein [Bacillus sp. DX4.1]